MARGASRCLLTDRKRHPYEYRVASTTADDRGAAATQVAARWNTDVAWNQHGHLHGRGGLDAHGRNHGCDHRDVDSSHAAREGAVARAHAGVSRDRAVFHCRSVADDGTPAGDGAAGYPAAAVSKHQLPPASR